MTDDPFDALWFLYHVARRDLGEMAGAGSTRVSALTHFHHAIHSALQRSNDTDAFLRSLEKTIGLDFDRFGQYEFGFPAPESFVSLFTQLKKHGVLYYMPRLIERKNLEKTPDAPLADAHLSQEAAK
jgi:hypothetical protein